MRNLGSTLQERFRNVGNHTSLSVTKDHLNSPRAELEKRFIGDVLLMHSASRTYFTHPTIPKITHAVVLAMYMRLTFQFLVMYIGLLKWQPNRQPLH
jgi:hypothetical protein